MKAKKTATPSPVPLPELLQINRNAMTVYGALRWMAGSKMQLGTMRKRIREVCHLSHEVITKAMKALKEGGWIKYSYGHKEGTNYRWYRITFVSREFFPISREDCRPKGSATRASAPQKDEIRTTAKNVPNRNPLLGGKNTPPLLEREGEPSSSSSPVGESSSSSHGKDQRRNHPPGSARKIGQEKPPQLLETPDGRKFERLPDGRIRPLDAKK